MSKPSIEKICATVDCLENISSPRGCAATMQQEWMVPLIEQGVERPKVDTAEEGTNGEKCAAENHTVQAGICATALTSKSFIKLDQHKSSLSTCEFEKIRTFTKITLDL